MAGHINDSSNLDWNTPAQILDPTRLVLLNIDLDPCSNSTSKVGAAVNYSLPEHDGLEDTWLVNKGGTTVYVNPPYGRCYIHKTSRDILLPKQLKARLEAIADAGARALEKKQWRGVSVIDWVKKANTSSQAGAEVIMLIPAAVDTKHWQAVIFPEATAICYVRGRIKFDGNVKGPAPMACACIYWGPQGERFCHVFKDIGFCINLEEGRKQHF